MINSQVCNLMLSLVSPTGNCLEIQCIYSMCIYCNDQKEDLDNLYSISIYMSIMWLMVVIILITLFTEFVIIYKHLIQNFTFWMGRGGGGERISKKIFGWGGGGLMVSEKFLIYH